MRGLKREEREETQLHIYIYMFFFSRFSFLACPAQQFRKVNCNKNLAKYFVRVFLEKGKRESDRSTFQKDTKWIGKRSNALFNLIPK